MYINRRKAYYKKNVTKAKRERKRDTHTRKKSARTSSFPYLFRLVNCYLYIYSVEARKPKKPPIPTDFPGRFGRYSVLRVFLYYDVTTESVPKSFAHGLCLSTMTRLRTDSSHVPCLPCLHLTCVPQNPSVYRSRLYS